MMKIHFLFTDNILESTDDVILIENWLYLIYLLFYYKLIPDLCQ